jgi:hypothetical protein
MPSAASHGKPTDEKPPCDSTTEAPKKENPLLKALNNFWHCDEVRKFRRDPRTLVEIIALVTVICYTHYASRSLDQLRKQTPKITESANAAKSAADTVARQLELSERPWVSIVPSIASPFWMDRNGANLILEFEVSNTGVTPAVGTSVYAKFFPPYHTAEEYESQMKEACESAIRLGRGSRDILVRDAPTRKKVHFIFSSSKIERDSRGGFFMVNIVACPAYQSTFNEVTYSHGQMYHFYRIDPNGGALAFKVGQTVPAKELHIGVETESVTLVEENYVVGGK